MQQGQLVSAPQCLGPQLEPLKAGGWNHLRAHPHTHLAVDAGCWLEPQFFSTSNFPCASSVRVGLDFLTAWRQSSEGKCSKRGSQEEVISPFLT